MCISLQTQTVFDRGVELKCDLVYHNGRGSTVVEGIGKCDLVGEDGKGKPIRYNISMWLSYTNHIFHLNYEPLFHKRTDVLPHNLVKARSRKIRILTFPVF